MLFDELKEKARKLLATEPKGIILTSFRTFTSTKKKIRQLNVISYRLLSLLLYSLIYYGEIMGFIKPEELKTVIISQKTTKDLIAENWKLLKSALENEGIGKIQVFFNMIFTQLEAIIAKYPDMSTIALRMDIEKDIVDYSTKALKEYSAYEGRYKEVNGKYLSRNPTSMKSLINELELPDVYSEDEYPFYKYFLLDNFSTVTDSFKQQIEALPDNSKLYPVIFNCINQSKDVEKLQSLSLMNPFVNYMIDRYSYQITREVAKKLIIENELRTINDKIINKQFESFIEGYDAVSSSSTKYKCRPEMKEYKISKADSIAYCLPDDGELFFGMYVTSAYEKFITWQNGFLTAVYESMGMNKISPYQNEALKKTISVQDAKHNDIATTTINEENSTFSCFDDLVGFYSMKNCLNVDGTINYPKYKLVEYQFDQIETELFKTILPGKKKFNEEIRFVTYGFEASRSNKSSVIQSFIDKYNEQTELKDNDKSQLKSCMKANKENNEQLMFSIQLLIFYISEKYNFPPKKSIHEVITEMPKFIVLSNACYSVFEKNKHLEVSQLIKVFEYIELLCFSSIVENLSIDKVLITEDVKKKVKDYFEKLDKNGLVNQENLATALRRFISRKLSGKRSDQDVKVEENVLFFLSQSELWESKVGNDNSLEDIVYNMMPGIKIEVSQAVDLYRLIGETELKIVESLNAPDEEIQGQAQQEKKPEKKIEKKGDKKPKRKGY